MFVYTLGSLHGMDQKKLEEGRYPVLNTDSEITEVDVRSTSESPAHERMSRPQFLREESDRMLPWALLANQNDQLKESNTLHKETNKALGRITTLLQRGTTCLYMTYGVCVVTALMSVVVPLIFN